MPWLFGETADLLFVANVAWPLVALLVWLNRRWLDLPFELLLTAFIGTPHRWITLGVLANDRDRAVHRWPVILGVGAATCAGFAGLWTLTRDVGLLLLVRYLWNVWHVAAQNTGVTRIYEIAGRPERRSRGEVERYLLRGYMVYAFLRVAGIAFAEDPARADVLQRLSLFARPLDGLVLLIPPWIAWREWKDFDRRLRAKYVHMASACLNYAAMIVCAHFGLKAWAIAVSVANAVFHATEYFSIVTWSIAKRSGRPESFFVPALARNWFKTLAFFLVSLAVTSAFLATKYALFWILLNTLVSYLHYAWDGVIWKMPAVFVQPKDSVAPRRTQPAPRPA